MDLTSALATVTAVSDLTKLVVSGKIDSEVKAKAAELNNSILALQGTLFSLQMQNQELLNSKNDAEAKLAQISNWQNTADHYYLYELCSGVFVYRLRDEFSNDQPSHFLCPNCFTNQKLSILMQSPKGYGGTTYSCKSSQCGAEYVNYENRATVSTPRRRW